VNTLGKHLVCRSDIREALQAAGVKLGDVLCVHTSLSALGYVCGGAHAVIEACMEAVGYRRGTIMMPAFTRDYSHPRGWRAPPAPEEWLPAMFDEMPAFDPDRSPTQGVGFVAELFRTWPDVYRSNHPISSVAAWGHEAKTLTGSMYPVASSAGWYGQSKFEPSHLHLDSRFGPRSPFGGLVARDGKVAMIGAPYSTMSLLHLTQYAFEPVEDVKVSACILFRGQRTWIEFNDVHFRDEFMEDCVIDMVTAGIAAVIPCGASKVTVVRASEAVDFALTWRRTHRR